jgi:hypothetical protein
MNRDLGRVPVNAGTAVRQLGPPGVAAVTREFAKYRNDLALWN